jgi:hypothetical protein
VLDTAFVYVPVGGQSIVVPAGFVTDLASVPRILTNIVPADGPWVKAAVIHDYLYATHGINGLYTRKQADGILREAMGVLGVSPFYRTVIYSGVRVGGWKGWGS